MVEKRSKENLKMVEKRSWEEFRANGMLWWVNRILHLFGWAIAFEMDDDNNIKEVYPVRCKFRGFGSESETRGFKKLTNYLVTNIQELVKDLDS